MHVPRRLARDNRGRSELGGRAARVAFATRHERHDLAGDRHQLIVQLCLGRLHEFGRCLSRIAMAKLVRKTLVVVIAGISRAKRHDLLSECHAGMMKKAMQVCRVESFRGVP